MAALSTRKRVRYTFDIHFNNTVDKEAFTKRLGEVRQALTPPGHQLLDNYGVMMKLFDIVESNSEVIGQLTQPEPVPITSNVNMSLMRNW